MNTPITINMGWGTSQPPVVLALGAKVAGEPTGWQILENGGVRIHFRYERGTGYADFHRDHVRDAKAALAAQEAASL